jgi:hypothetical protein
MALVIRATSSINGPPVTFKATVRGLAIYLDDWAVGDLAEGDPSRCKRFIAALWSGSADLDGTYLGEVVHENYVLRNTSKVEPVARVPKIEPISPVPPVAPVNRVGRVGRVGWIDALAEL